MNSTSECNPFVYHKEKERRSTLLLVSHTSSSLIHAFIVAVLSYLWKQTSRSCQGMSHFLSLFHASLCLLYFIFSTVKFPLILKHFCHSKIANVWISRVVTLYSTKKYIIALLTGIVLEIVVSVHKNICSDDLDGVLIWFSRVFYVLSFFTNILCFSASNFLRFQDRLGKHGPKK